MPSQLGTIIESLAVSQIFLTGLFYFVYFRTSRLGLLVSCLCICFICAVTSPVFQNDLLNYIDGRIAAATPAFLWLFAHALFEDDKKISLDIWLYIIGYQLARGFVTFVYQFELIEENLILTMLNSLGLIIAFGLAVHVVVMAIRDISNDLLEARRRIRGPFAAGLGIVMAFMVAGVLLPSVLDYEIAPQTIQYAYLTSDAFILLFFLTTNLLTFQLTPKSQLFIESVSIKSGEKPSNAFQLAESEKALVKELDRRMLNEKLFSQPELTIGHLAELLSVQEYKLRVIINRELGYKNFNQFLNHYRVTEACNLLEKKTKHRNISIVAQDVGYISLSTFNTAFKKLKGVTPSQYKAAMTNNE